MRAAKESLVVSDCDLKVPITQYMNWLEFGLRGLTPLEKRALFLRFWEPFTIAQVADRMGLSWEGADQLIDLAVKKIRQSFRSQMGNPASSQLKEESYENAT